MGRDIAEVVTGFAIRKAEFDSLALHQLAAKAKLSRGVVTNN